MPHYKSEEKNQLEFLTEALMDHLDNMYSFLICKSEKLTKNIVSLKKTEVLKRKESAQSATLLEACELLVKKVNDHSAEYKAGEYGEKASNACKTGDDS